MEKKLSELFKTCENLEYDVAGKDVNYKFVEEGKTLYIYFQGSSSTTDWIRNFLFKKRPYKDMEAPYKVHRGFLRAWKEVEDIVIAKITEKKGVVRRTYRWKKIIVVGYSHGGALSGLCHECVWFHRPDLREGGLEGYGFEAPRFFGAFRMPEALKERWATYTVVRTNSDIVTHCPPRIFGFCAAGNMLHLRGDASLIRGFIPKCIKSHYPEVVEDALLKREAAGE